MTHSAFMDTRTVCTNGMVSAGFLFGRSLISSLSNRLHVMCLHVIKYLWMLASTLNDTLLSLQSATYLPQMVISLDRRDQARRTRRTYPHPEVLQYKSSHYHIRCRDGNVN